MNRDCLVSNCTDKSSFIITTSAGSKYKFQSSSEDERSHWVEAIMSAFQQQQVTVNKRRRSRSSPISHEPNQNLCVKPDNAKKRHSSKDIKISEIRDQILNVGKRCRISISSPRATSSPL